MFKSEVFKRICQHYDLVVNKGYEVVGVFLQGSQNYGLDYEGSDVDSKAIILPTFNDFVLNNTPVSTTLVLDNNEHIDLKDIRLMFDCFKKQNINFVEILFTEYAIFNSKYRDLFYPLIQAKELIARYNNYAAINCMYGMSLEKLKALEHPYPSIIDKIEKYHYDPKQLHHILRLYEFLERYINGEEYRDCLQSRQSDFLIDVKKGYYSLLDARRISKQATEHMKLIKTTYMNDYPIQINRECENILNTVLIDIMKYNFTTELERNKK